MKKRFFIFCFSFCITGFVFALPGPNAVNDTLSVAQNSNGNTINVIANDMDVNGGLLSVTILSAPQHGMGTVINANQVNYTPTPYFFGIDSFSYSVCDTFHLCDTAEVYITVVGHAYPPVAVLDTFNFPDTLVSAVLNVLANDTDPQKDSLFVSSVANINGDSVLGKLQLDSATGQVTFVHTPYSCGTDTFEYTVCDVLNVCSTASVIITINCPDNVSLPQGISPNGDGKNDLLIFTWLEYFAPATLTVFNRYGNPVYQSDDYKNDWGGTNRDNGKALPDGTYFYVLVLSNHHKYVNYLIINR